MRYWIPIPHIKHFQDHCVKKQNTLRWREGEGVWRVDDGGRGGMSYLEWVFGKQVHQQDQHDQAEERHNLADAPLGCVQSKPHHHECQDATVYNPRRRVENRTKIHQVREGGNSGGAYGPI